MRWIRTAATTLSSITAALIIIWGGLVWLVEPRLHEWAEELVDAATVDMKKTSEENTIAIQQMQELMGVMQDAVTGLTELVEIRRTPSWRFDGLSTNISDGPIGGYVDITAGGFKLADCGVPVVDLYFINGDEIYHRFEDVTLLTEEGRGVAFSVDPSRIQTIKYRARIPADDGVTPGRGRGFISVTYPDACPHNEPVVAGPLYFRITQ